MIFIDILCCYIQRYTQTLRRVPWKEERLDCWTQNLLQMAFAEMAEGQIKADPEMLGGSQNGGPRWYTVKPPRIESRLGIDWDVS